LRWACTEAAELLSFDVRWSSRLPFDTWVLHPMRHGIRARHPNHCNRRANPAVLARSRPEAGPMQNIFPVREGVSPAARTREFKRVPAAGRIAGTGRRRFMRVPLGCNATGRFIASVIDAHPAKE